MNGPKKYALDSSILIHNFYLKDPKIDLLIKNGVTNIVALSECYYILCRKENNQIASKYIDTLMNDIQIISSDQIVKIVGQFKCKFSIALADCWTLATAFALKIVAVFAFKEKELVKNLNDIFKEVELKFFEDTQ
ncbi:MAG TPA: PIN domain-containing protein [Candidatus Deferrimicrobium sp.]|nr:PIN domain-containing protein [Candidatus Deferrimicrobium sp.]